MIGTLPLGGRMAPWCRAGGAEPGMASPGARAQVLCPPSTVNAAPVT